MVVGPVSAAKIGDGALHSIESGSDSERCEALLVEAFQERLGEQGGCME